MKLQSHNGFWQEIHKTAKEKGFPLRVMFELTYRCNFRCGHCYVPLGYQKQSGRELNTREVLSILNQLADIGCLYLGFTGGEPFLREDIFNILWHAKKKGFQLIIYTNGSLIDKDKARELKRLNPNKVDITIPALDRKVFELITGVKEPRDNVFEAIRLLHQNKVELGFKSCLLKENENEIKDIQDFAVSLGASYRLGTMLLPCLDGDIGPYRYRGKIEEELVVSRKPQAVSQEPEPRKAKPEPLFKCGVGMSQAAITPFGELKMCLMIDYPKYRIIDTDTAASRKSSLRNAWSNLKKLVLGIKPEEKPRCDKCQLYDHCKWCPAKGWLFDRSFTTCGGLVDREGLQAYSRK